MSRGVLVRGGRGRFPVPGGVIWWDQKGVQHHDPYAPASPVARIAPLFMFGFFLTFASIPVMAIVNYPPGLRIGMGCLLGVAATLFLVGAGCCYKKRNVVIPMIYPGITYVPTTEPVTVVPPGAVIQFWVGKKLCLGPPEGYTPPFTIPDDYTPNILPMGFPAGFQVPLMALNPGYPPSAHPFSGYQQPQYPMSGYPPQGYPIPGQPPPGNPVPGYPYPGNPTPGHPSSAPQVPGYPPPGNPVPGYPPPGNPIPGHPSSANQVPGYPSPAYPVPLYAPPAYPIPGQPSPGNPIQGYPYPSHPISGQPTTNNPIPGQPPPGESIPDQPPPSYPGTGYPRPDDSKSGH